MIKIMSEMQFYHVNGRTVQKINLGMQAESGEKLQ